MIEPMIEPVTVWAVRIGVSDRETEGRLSLEPAALVFDLANEEGALRIALRDVRKARRVRGSPILVVDSIEEKRQIRFAFYFVKPPPLVPQGRESKGRVKRKAVGYLQTANGHMKDVVREWEQAVRRAMAAVDGGAEPS
jgi:hypothetical protein